MTDTDSARLKDVVWVTNLTPATPLNGETVDRATACVASRAGHTHVASQTPRPREDVWKDLIAALIGQPGQDGAFTAEQQERIQRLFFTRYEGRGFSDFLVFVRETDRLNGEQLFPMLIKDLTGTTLAAELVISRRLTPLVTLLSYNPDLSWVDTKGNTLSDLARENGMEDAATILAVAARCNDTQYMEFLRYLKNYVEAIRCVRASEYGQKALEKKTRRFIREIRRKFPSPDDKVAENAPVPQI